MTRLSFSFSRLKRAIPLVSIVMLSACGEQAVQNNADKPNENKLAKALKPVDQGALDSLANSLQIQYRFLSNIETDCPDNKGKPVEHCYSAEILLTNTRDFYYDQWQLNFSQVYPAYAAKSEEFNLEHLNGDIHQITPSQEFKGFAARQSKKVKLWVQSTLIGESEVMPNYWLSAEQLTANVVASTTTGIDPETGLETQPYVVSFDDIPKQIKSSPKDVNQYASPQWLFDNTLTSSLTTEQRANHLKTAVIPTPKSLVISDKHQQIDLSTGINVTLNGVERVAVDAALARLKLLGIGEKKSGIAVVINHTDQRDVVAEGYELKIDDNRIVINANDQTGAFYALQTIAGMVSIGDFSLPYLTVSDAPHYSYRGQHIDVARNFHSKAMILSLIEQMAAYKLNKLHLHLAEDEGWRLQLPSFPELTQIGSQRCMDLSDKHCMQPQLGGANANDRDGFYSVEDYKEILMHATRHHIEVIPSLDMPGHSRAAIKAMEARYHYFMQQENEQEAIKYLLTDFDDKTQYSSIQNYKDNTINICMESSYVFVDQVLEDLMQIHHEANHPLKTYHIGADETAGAWLESPVCQALIADKSNDVNDAKHMAAHFIERVSHMVSAKGIAVGGWNDGLGETKVENMPSNVYSYIWGALPWGANQQLSEQAHRNWQVVLSVPDVLYFDFPYQVDPKERGYHWASRRITSRNIFNFMPDNLPIHAEFRLDTLGQPYRIDDTLQKNDGGEIVHRPLPKGFNVAGIQGQLWSETVRSETQAQYMIFPRMLVLAERAWHQPKWHVPYNYQGAAYDRNSHVFTNSLQQKRDQSWLQFAATLGNKELPKLEQADVFYRIPTVGAKVIAGQLHMNVLIDGLPMEYKDADGDWRQYQQPTAVKLPVSVRAMSVDGQRKGRATIIN